MKRLSGLIVVLCALALPLSTVAALSGEELRAASSDLARFTELARGADAEELMQAAQAAVRSIDAAALDPQSREKALALPVASVVAIGGEQGADRVAQMIADAPASLRTSITAAAVVAAGNRSRTVFKRVLDAVGADSPDAAAVRSAAGNPSSVLSPDTIAAIKTFLGAPVVPAVPLQEPTTVPLVPPLIPPGNEPPPEPPRARRYPGQ